MFIRLRFLYLCKINIIFDFSNYNTTEMRLLNRKPEFPSTYVIIFAVTLIAAAVTWFVPGGEYVTGADGVTFVRRQSVPQTWQIMTSLYEGFTAQAGIIVFLLIIGGAFWIVNSAKAVDAGTIRFWPSLRGWKGSGYCGLSG